jgi:hypothetical protein
MWRDESVGADSTGGGKSVIDATLELGLGYRERYRKDSNMSMAKKDPIQ